MGVDADRTSVVLTLPASCPFLNQRGSLFVPTARVDTSLTDSTPATVAENWIVLCSRDVSNHDVYLRLSPKACDGGAVDSESPMPYKDCTDVDATTCDNAQVN
jgi:hypothetical protein